MRWIVFLPLTLLIGFWQMLARPFAISDLPYLEILFLVAFQSGRYCPVSYVLPAFWWCGIVHDLFLGNRLGASTILFSLAGLFFAWIRGHFRHQRWIVRFGLVVVTLLPILLLRPVLEQRALHGVFSGPVFWLALRRTALTAVLGLILGRVMEWKPLRTWRDEPSISYGAGHV